MRYIVKQLGKVTMLFLGRIIFILISFLNIKFFRVIIVIHILYCNNLVQYYNNLKYIVQVFNVITYFYWTYLNYIL